MKDKHTKLSTFEQIIKAQAAVDAQLDRYLRAQDRLGKVVAAFPECKLKIFKHGAKTYVVTRQRDSTISILEAEV